jgi:hypothetical protein
MDYRSATQTRPENHEHAEQGDHQLKPFDDLMEYVVHYTRERPEVVVLTCLGIGFILGWKLKPW